MRHSTLLILSTVFLAIHGISQQPTLVIQQGHKSEILFDDFNLNEAAWLTVDHKEAFCWNIPTGRQLRRIALASQIRGGAFVKNGEEIVLAADDLDDSRLNFFDSRTGEKTGEMEFVDNRYPSLIRKKNWKTIDQLIRNRDGSRIAVKSFNKIHFVDVSQRKWLSEIQLPSYDSKFGFISENRLVVTMLDGGKLQLIKLDSAGNVQKKSTIEKNIKPECLEIHPNLSLFAIGFKDGSIFILDEELKIQKEIIPQPQLSGGSAVADISFNSNGNELLVSAGVNIYRYDLTKNEAKQFITRNVTSGEKVAFCPSNENNILRYSGFIPYQFDLATGKEVHAYYVNSPRMDQFFFNSKGDRMISYTMELDLRTGTSRKVFDAGYREKILAQLSDSVIVCSYEKDEYVKNKWIDNAGIQGRNIRNGKVIFQVRLPIKFSTIYVAISNDKKAIAVSDDLGGNLFLLSGDRYSKLTPIKVQKGRAVRGLTFTPDGKTILAGSSNYSDTLRRYDIEKKAWSDLLDVKVSVFENYLPVTADSRFLLFRISNLLKPGSTERFQLGFYDLKKNRIAKKFKVDEMISRIAISPKNDLFAVGFFDGHVEVYKWNDTVPFLSYHAHNQVIDQLEFGKTNDWIMTRADDGLLSIWNWKQSKKIVDLFNVYSADRAIAMVTAENYYMMPPGVIREIHFAKGFQTYSVSQFDLVLNRPDKVLERIGMAEPNLIEMYQKAIARRMKKNGVDGNPDLSLDQLQPLIIENRKSIPSNTAVPVLPLKINTANKEVREYLLYINNQLVEKAKPSAGNWVEFKVALSEGVNNIELAYLSSKGIESLHERIEIKFESPTPIVSKRYYIGIGVSAYKDSSRNLRYAAKDVEDIQEKFKKADTNTILRLYRNEEVTKQQLAQIKQMLAQTTIHDQVIISFSGHGLLDTAYNFYFATHDMNFADPASKGFSYADIESLFDNIAARKKLILIDACQSGSVERELLSGEDAEIKNDSVKSYSRGGIVAGNQKKSELSSSIKLMQQYFADISKGKGAVVISASAGEENALESNEWKNGVFTYCFIQAVFEGKGDTNRDGHVSVSEVKEYMEKEVLRLTNGRQRPASRKENLEWDWWIK